MFSALTVLTGAATPTPTPEIEVDPNLVTPGPAGFLAILFVTVAVILLVWDMMRRIRRGRVRADIAEQLDAEEAQARGEGPVAEESFSRPEDDSPGGDPRSPRG